MTQLNTLELIAIISGITSVWFSKKGNIWVYPVGLLNTTIYIYLSFKGELYGEASVNVFYTVMSLYGWYNWLRRGVDEQFIVKISYSSNKDRLIQLLFFLTAFVVIYTSLVVVKDIFSPGSIPWADALASASAFTAMWLMTRKKVESWIWWIVTNIVSIPLFYVKDFTLTAFYYGILLILAVFGLQEWRKKANG
ncbi:MAG: nicotinamide riboside transporter PnuC [bacterium]|jgi:nicotinamide mononucleotide transporter